MVLSGIILAAGESRRMGQTKALLDYGGEKFVDRLRRILNTCCRDVIVVGAPQSTFRADVVNPDPSRGMLSSLQCGLAAVPDDSEAVMWTLVDLPAVDIATVAKLAAPARGDVLRIPRHIGKCGHGKRGHPIWMARSLAAEFLHGAGTPKDIILRHEKEIVYVDVDDPGVVMDTDTPEDYQRLTAASECR